MWLKSNRSLKEIWMRGPSLKLTGSCSTYRVKRNWMAAQRLPSGPPITRPLSVVSCSYLRTTFALTVGYVRCCYLITFLIECSDFDSKIIKGLDQWFPIGSPDPIPPACILRSTMMFIKKYKRKAVSKLPK